MDFDDLRDRFDAFTAELVRQALTLEELATLDVEELVPYFELRAEKVYEEYRARLESPDTHNRSPKEREDYLNILRRRWQEAEELAHIIAKAETATREAHAVRAVGA